MSFEAQSGRGQRGGIDLDAHGGFCAAADERLTDAFDLAELLADDIVGVSQIHRRSGSVSEVIARIMMGESAGLTLR